MSINNLESTAFAAVRGCDHYCYPLHELLFDLVMLTCDDDKK